MVAHLTKLSIAFLTLAVGATSTLSFTWPASQIDDFSSRLDHRLVELGQPKIRRFEYDYQSSIVYIDSMGESEFRYQVQAGVRDHLKHRVAELRGLTDDAGLRQRIRSLVERGTFDIKYKDQLYKQAYVTFGQAGALPSLVCEVS
jgi:hypothetical protein